MVLELFQITTYRLGAPYFFFMKIALDAKKSLSSGEC